MEGNGPEFSPEFKPSFDFSEFILTAFLFTYTRCTTYFCESLLHI